MGRSKTEKRSEGARPLKSSSLRTVADFQISLLLPSCAVERRSGQQVRADAAQNPPRRLGNQHQIPSPGRPLFSVLTSSRFTTEQNQNALIYKVGDGKLCPDVKQNKKQTKCLVQCKAPSRCSGNSLSHDNGFGCVWGWLELRIPPERARGICAWRRLPCVGWWAGMVGTT